VVTIFSAISALAQQHGAINLGQGFPDYPVDHHLAGLVHDAIANGYNQYAPMPGLPALREAVAADVHARMDATVHPDEITITPGATYAIYTAFASVLAAGDEAIVLEPAYDSYIPNIRACGGVPVPVPLRPADFSPDFDRIAAAITPRTRAIILNTPHNPTGAVWTTGDWQALEEVLRNREDIILIADEVYAQIVFDGRRHTSVLHYPTLRNRAFAVYSFGKSLHATGWKMGYCIAPPALTQRFRALHQYLAFSVNAPMQKALADYLPLPQPEPPHALLQRKRDLFLDLLRDTPFTPLAPAAGAYFQLAALPKELAMPDRVTAEHMIQTAGVAAIPVSAFYHDGYDAGLLRFCFAKEDDTLRAATARLAAHGKSLSNTALSQSTESPVA